MEKPGGRFAAEEERTLRVAFRSNSELLCPICDVALDRRPVPPRSDVSYVRDRLWVTCPRCRRALVLDHRQPE
jgi:hypothetical protein